MLLKSEDFHELTTPDSLSQTMLLRALLKATHDRDPTILPQAAEMLRATLDDLADRAISRLQPDLVPLSVDLAVQELVAAGWTPPARLSAA